MSNATNALEKFSGVHYNLPEIERETVNYSNIPSFNRTVVDTIIGDNVLLFPLGLARGI